MSPHLAPRRLRAGRIVAGLISGALFLLLYWFSNRTVVGQSLENSWAWAYDVDRTVGKWLDLHHLPPFSFDRQTIVVGIVLALVIAAVRKDWRGAILIAVALPGSIAASALFKSVFERPTLVESLDDSVSYPSGHAGICLAVSAAILIAVPRRWLPGVAPVVGAWMAVATSAIQAVGNHRPSEIIGSALLVSAVFLLVGAAVTPRSARLEIDARRLRATITTLAPHAVGGIALGGTIIATAVLGAWGAIAWMSVFYAVAAVAATALTIAVAVGLRSAGSTAGVAAAGARGAAG